MGGAHGETEIWLGSWMRGVVYNVYSLDYGFMLKRSLAKNKTGDSFKGLLVNKMPRRRTPCQLESDGPTATAIVPPYFLRYATLILCPSVTHCFLCIFPAALPHTEAMHSPTKMLSTFLCQASIPSFHTSYIITTAFHLCKTVPALGDRPTLRSRPSSPTFWPPTDRDSRHRLIRSYQSQRMARDRTGSWKPDLC